MIVYHLRNGGKSKNIKALCNIQEGIVLVCSNNDTLQRSAINSLALGLSRKNNLRIFSGRQLTGLQHIKNSVATPLFKSFDGDGRTTGWDMSVSATEPFGAAIIDHSMGAEDWDKIDLVRRSVLGGPVFVSVEAFNITEALFQLDRMGKLSDLLRYGQLSAIAQISPSFDREDNPVESFVRLSRRTQSQLLAMPPHEWDGVLNVLQKQSRDDEDYENDI